MRAKQLAAGEAITLDGKDVGIIHSTAKAGDEMIGLVLLKLTAKEAAEEDKAQMMAGAYPVSLL